MQISAARIVARDLETHHRSQPVFTRDHASARIRALPLYKLIRNKICDFEDAEIGFEKETNITTRPRLRLTFLAPPAGQVDILAERQKRELWLHLVDKQLLNVGQGVLGNTSIVRHIATLGLMILHTNKTAHRFQPYLDLLTAFDVVNTMRVSIVFSAGVILQGRTAAIVKRIEKPDASGFGQDLVSSDQSSHASKSLGRLLRANHLCCAEHPHFAFLG